MSRVSTYLNLMGETEEAFLFYRSVFGTEFVGELTRMGDMPGGPGMPALSEAEKNLVALVVLAIGAATAYAGTRVAIRALLGPALESSAASRGRLSSRVLVSAAATIVVVALAAATSSGKAMSSSCWPSAWRTSAWRTSEVEPRKQ